MRLAEPLMKPRMLRLGYRPESPSGTVFSAALAGLLLAFCLVPAAWANPAGKAKAKSAEAAARASAASPQVDSAKVRRLYLDGEFDAAIVILENNLKASGQYRHEDSVFIFKHLGVMYAAQYDTREKGKYYMHKLLLVEPTAKIMDMYASDMIYMIFKNIQEEYEQTRMGIDSPRQKRPRQDSMPVANPVRETSPAETRRTAETSASTGSGKKWIWAGVAAVTVAAGVGAYVLMNEEQPKPSQNEVRF